MTNEEMAMLRMRAQADQRFQPIGYKAVGPFDGFGQPAGHVPVYSDEDQMMINQLETGQRAYNSERGTTYSGGATQAGPLSAPLVQMVRRPDTSGGLVQVGPLSSGNAQPATFNDALGSYYDEFNNKLNLVY